jgi:hypothetical protein
VPADGRLEGVHVWAAGGVGDEAARDEVAEGGRGVGEARVEEVAAVGPFFGGAGGAGGGGGGGRVRRFAGGILPRGGL